MVVGGGGQEFLQIARGSLVWNSLAANLVLNRSVSLRRLVD